MINPAIQDPPEPSAMQNDWLLKQRELIANIANFRKYYESIDNDFYVTQSDILDKFYGEITDFEKEVKAMECPDDKELVADND